MLMCINTGLIEVEQTSTADGKSTTRLWKLLTGPIWEGVHGQDACYMQLILQSY